MRKDLSPASSSESYLDYASDAMEVDFLPGSEDSDLESLPPESLNGSFADDLCPSPLDFFGDIDDWTPAHDPNVIHR